MPKPVKSIRMSQEARRLLELTAAYEQRTEGEIIEAALPLYLQMRALAYGNRNEVARELANSTPETAGAVLEKVTAAIEQALGAGQRAPEPGSGKARLQSRVASRAA